MENIEHYFLRLVWAYQIFIVIAFFKGHLKLAVWILNFITLGIIVTTCFLLTGIVERSFSSNTNQTSQAQKGPSHSAQFLESFWGFMVIGSLIGLPISIIYTLVTNIDVFPQVWLDIVGLVLGDLILFAVMVWKAIYYFDKVSRYSPK